MHSSISETPQNIIATKRNRHKHEGLGYAATAVVTAVGAVLWCWAGRSAGFWARQTTASMTYIGLTLTLVLGVLALAVIRLAYLIEDLHRQLAESRQAMQTQSQSFRETEQQLNLMFSANPSPMWIYDRATLQFLDVNDAAVRQYGYSRDEFLRMTIKDIRPAEEIASLIHDIDEFYWGHSSRGVWRHRRKDGTLLLAEITTFKYEKGGRIQYIVLANDVTKRVQAEEELRRSQASLRSLIDNAPFGICRGSIEGDRFETVNPAFSEMLGGYSPEELQQLKLSTQVYADARDRARLMATIRRNRKIHGFETTMIKRDRSKVRVRITGVLTTRQPDDQESFEGYVEDLTQQSSLEQQVRQVQKLEAVGRLAGGMAHDFNNILVVIKLSTEMMLHQVTPDSPLTKPLLQVSKAADRAAALTRQMLAFGRQQMMQVRILNVNTVVADITNMLRRIIGEDIELKTKLATTLPNTKLDADQLGQVLLNLAVNARDAMPDGGTLHLETATVELDNTYTKEHPPVVPGQYVMLVVTDTGTGIEKAALPHIFDPFFTTKEVGKGTGLGLSIVYGIVKQSGGYIWVYSEPSHGTTFKLYFPATNAVPEQSPVNTANRVQCGGKGVLLVDDEAMVRCNVSECLRQLGYRVLEADCAERALVLCDEQRDSIDIVLTDLVMPGMGGHELADLLAERHPELQILFMSGYTEDNAARRDILMKGSPFLQKPFSVAELSSGIQKILESAAIFDQVVN